MQYSVVQCSSDQCNDKKFLCSAVLAFFCNAMGYAELHISAVAFKTIHLGNMKSFMNIYIPQEDLCERIVCHGTHIIITQQEMDRL